MHFRKKPVIVEAYRWDGNLVPEFYAFVGEDFLVMVKADPPGHEPCLVIPTLEGQMLARVGDWIVKGIKGEFYPCKPDIFEATYEPLDA
jgi:hypothetical protein